MNQPNTAAQASHRTVQKSVAREADEILLASKMIKLGARLQVLQAETSLSYDRLARLYREIRRSSPPKGMLPYSADWYITWLPNIHATIFYSYFAFIDQHTPSKGTQALVDAYSLYIEYANVGKPVAKKSEPVLSFTRAWLLLRFIDSNILQLAQCSNCKGKFISHSYELNSDFVCSICKPPPRAGRSLANKAAKVRTKTPAVQ